MVLAHRHRVGIAVHRGRGTEDELVHAGLGHRRAQRQRAADVVVVILDRPGDGFANRLQPGEMQHRIDGVLAENPAQRRHIAHVALVKRHRPAGDPLDAPEHLAPAVAQVVGHHHAVAGLQQFDASVGTDIAGPAGHQERFRWLHVMQAVAGDIPARAPPAVA
jgi:hypothetical protein